MSRSLEKDLPDDVCKELGDQSREMYQQGRYVEGIEKYVNAIINRLEAGAGSTFLVGFCALPRLPLGCRSLGRFFVFRDLRGAAIDYND